MPEDRAGKEDTAERLLTENREVVLQLHGGGYIGKMKNAYRDFAVLYARMPGERAVLSVDYRVAPEDPYPAESPTTRIGLPDVYKRQDVEIETNGVYYD